MILSRRTLIAGLAVTTAVGHAAPARACSCGYWRDAAEHMGAREVVFLGRAVKSELLADPSRAITTFEVIRTAKGQVSHRVLIRHGSVPDGSCGTGMLKGWRGVVGAQRDDDGVLYVGLCDLDAFPWRDYLKARGASG